MTTGTGAASHAVHYIRNASGSWVSAGATLDVGLDLPSYAFVTLQAQQITRLEQSYAQLKESIYRGLVLQTRLKPYLDEIGLHIDENGLRLDFTGLEALMDARFAEDPANAVIDRLDLLEYAGEFLTPGGWEAFGQIDAWLSQAERRDDWEAIRATLAGTLDTFQTAVSAGNDFRIGTDSAEIYAASNGDDTTYARRGEDTLNGGAGNDIILFNAGNGQDTVSSSSGGGGDTLSLGGGIACGDLAFSKSGKDLVLKTGGDDQITFQDWYTSSSPCSAVTLQMVAEAMEGFESKSYDLDSDCGLTPMLFSQ